MEITHRVLPVTAFPSLDDYLNAGGGLGIEAVRRQAAAALLNEIAASGLQGRGGAGFPTARKLQAVLEHGSDVLPTTVVVNGAEGEPGSFKDRAILAANPYQVIEGALLAARLLDAGRVVVALKETSDHELECVERAIAEVTVAGWAEGIELVSFAGPRSYLYGEETALLEAIDGRPPFPRIAPPYRRGVDEVLEEDATTDTTSVSAANLDLAGPEHVAPPAFASNVETFANLPGILGRGAEWFRSLGTDRSPGTIVCTVSGDTEHAGVVEVPFGTPLGELIETVGGSIPGGHGIGAVMSGVANPLLTPADLDLPLSHEAMRAAGVGLGCAGFVVFDDRRDLVAVAAGIARFLAVESCGQCAACKGDGLEIARVMEALSRSDPDEADLAVLDARLATVTDGARCNLATQQQVVGRSVRERFSEAVAAHAEGTAEPVEPVLVAEILRIDDGRAVLDESQAHKQPDWTYDEVDSGQWPADRLDAERAGNRV